MKGIVEREALEHDMALRQRGLETCDGRRIAGEGDALRAVDGRDLDAPIDIERLEQSFSIAACQRNRGHAPPTSGGCLMRAALVDDAYRLLQSECAARPGRSHFPDAVAADGNRPNPPVLEHAGEAHL